MVANEIELPMAVGTGFQGNTHTIREAGLVQAFVNRQQVKGHRSLRKIPYYLGAFFTWLEDQGLELRTLTPMQAEEYQSYLVTKQTGGLVHYASRTVMDMVKHAEAFYAYLKDRGLVARNPFYGMQHIKASNLLPRHVPSQKEMSELLEGLRQFWKESGVGKRRNRYKVHVMAELMYSTGMRLDELAHLEVPDIDFRGSVVTINHAKGGVVRKAYLNEYAREILRLYIETMREDVNWNKENTSVFGTADGRGLDKAFNGWLKQTCGMTSHTFRHAVGTHLLQRGCDLRFIQLILGHEDLKSTALYTKISKEDLKVELDKFHPRS